jgi:hypothetical protein
MKIRFRIQKLLIVVLIREVRRFRIQELLIGVLFR